MFLQINYRYYLGICAGDIKKLSAASVLKSFYEAELTHGSVVRKMMSRKKDEATKMMEDKYKDLVDLRKHFNPQNLSVWKIDSGMSSLVNNLVEHLVRDGYVKLNLNESVEHLTFKNNNQIQVKSTRSTENFDMVISSVYSRCNSENVFL